MGDKGTEKGSRAVRRVWRPEDLRRKACWISKRLVRRAVREVEIGDEWVADANGYGEMVECTARRMLI